MKAEIKWNGTRGKYELVAKGKVLSRSKRFEHLEYLVRTQKYDKIVKAGVTDCEVVSHPGDGVTVSTPDATEVYAGFSIDERFAHTEQLVYMVINGTAKSCLITGEGGVGKTYLVVKCLETAGKVNVNKCAPTIEELEEVKVSVEDDEIVIEQKVAKAMNRPTGDFVVVKGYASAAALYRILWENRNRIIIFDDCDSVFKHTDALMLLKSALDSYEERWVAWNVERQRETDLPDSFQFKGAIIFISNLPLEKIDEAVRTRCFKVDISMTKQQRIARIRSQLPNVMIENPKVTPQVREEALALMEKHLKVIKDVNFRSLMNVISVRIDPNVGQKPDWEKLGLFVLLER